jgi:exodeoxyribonuclease VII small subunit|tara:strand:+ start:1946 stop:2200 length:255 start_codon:yes stop_codon:yes gene_type:complete
MPKSKKLGKTKIRKTASFEEKLSKLKEIVEELEEGEIPLKESMDNYQGSLDLIRQCYEELENAELKIEKIMKKEGKIITESLDD